MRDTECSLYRRGLMSERRMIFAEDLLGNRLNESYREDVCSKPYSEKEQFYTNTMECEKDSIEYYFNPEKEIVVESACFSCNSNCEVLIYLDRKTSDVLRVEGNPNSPHSRGR